MNTTITDKDQLDLADRRVLDAVHWSRRFALHHLAVLLPGVALGVYVAWSGTPLYGGLTAGYFLALCGAVLVFRELAKRDKAGLPDVDLWRQQVLGYALCAGIGWGACGALLVDPASTQSLYLVSVLTLAAVAGGVVLLSFSFLAQLAFLLPALLPLLIRVGAADLLTSLGAVATLAAFGVIALVTSREKGLFDERTAFRLKTEDQEQKVQSALDQMGEAEGARLRMARERDAIREEMGELNRQAQQAALTKDEFLATMSHEIRTPLNGIIPLLDLMRGSKLDEEQRAHMSTILASSRHLLSIIDSMLDYSKMQAGKLELETVGFNLSDLLDSVTKLLSGSARRKHVALESQLESNVRVAVRGDPVRLRQVLTNLVSNAVKFTEEGSVRITVSAVAETVAEYRLRFRIVDTGIGMDEATLDKLFTPFTQADASVTRNFGGSGLGLVICKQMVELMGGEIGVKSTVGQGSDFWFEIPLKKAVGDIAPEARQLAGVRMLMVSSDDTFKVRTSRFAQNSGCNVDLATSAKEAVEKVKKGHKDGGYWDFDLLAIDATSVGPQGLVLAKKLGTHPKIAKPCLIMNAGGKVPPALEEVPKIAAVTSHCSTEELAEAISGLVKTAPDKPATAASRALETTEFTEEEPISAKVLVVEDNHINLNVASSLMESLGLKFDVAQNGQEALAMMEKGDFDAVLMDCMMPVMDGYTAASKWREIEERNGLKRMPIIAMTANAMSGDMEKCLGAGMDAYLSKPLDRHLIADTLRRLLTGEDGAGEPSGAPAPSAKVVAKAAPKTSPAPISAPKAESADEVDVDFDDGILTKLEEVMGNRVEEVVQSYIADSPGNVEKIREALRGGTMEKVGACAHELKSTSASLGVNSVKKLCQSIELAARDSDIDRINETLEQLPDALDRAIKALREFKPVAA